MKIRIIRKNSAADPETGFLTLSILKPYGRVAAMPTAWELKLKTTGTGDTGAIGTPTFRSWKVDCSVFIGGSWNVAAETPLGKV